MSADRLGQLGAARERRRARMEASVWAGSSVWARSLVGRLDVGEGGAGGLSHEVALELASAVAAGRDPEAAPATVAAGREAAGRLLSAYWPAVRGTVRSGARWARFRWAEGDLVAAVVEGFLDGAARWVVTAGAGHHLVPTCQMYARRSLRREVARLGAQCSGWTISAGWQEDWAAAGRPAGEFADALRGGVRSLQVGAVADLVPAWDGGLGRLNANATPAVDGRLNAELWGLSVLLEMLPAATVAGAVDKVLARNPSARRVGDGERLRALVAAGSPTTCWGWLAGVQVEGCVQAGRAVGRGWSAGGVGGA